MKRLNDRLLLVVGAGTRATDDPEAPIGNGRAISILAAREGAALACADIDAEAAGTTVREIEADGGRAVPIVADVSDPDQCAQMVDSAVDALGGLDGIVLNV